MKSIVTKAVLACGDQLSGASRLPLSALHRAKVWRAAWS